MAQAVCLIPDFVLHGTVATGIMTSDSTETEDSKITELYF